MALTKLDPSVIGQDSSGSGKITSAGGSVSIDSSGNVRIANTTANTITITSAGALTFSDASTQATAATGFGFKNRIINGAMMVAQYGTAIGIAGGGATGYSTDRFKVYSASNTCTTQQSSVAPTGFAKSTLFTQTGTGAVAAGDIGLIIQRIEGFNIADLGWGTSVASPVTLSFWVRASLTGTFGVSIINDAQDRRFQSSYTINSANTWEYKTITFLGDTSGTWRVDNGIGLGVYWDLGCGTTYSGAVSSTWASTSAYGLTGGTKICSTTNATFYITGVQLEKGTTATPFDWRPYGIELALCQRYYQRQFPVRGVGVSTSGTIARVKAPLIVTMRATPTPIMVNTINIYDGSTTYTASAFNQVWMTPDILEFDAIMSGSATAGKCLSIYNDVAGGAGTVSTGGVTLSAEL